LFIGVNIQLFFQKSELKKMFNEYEVVKAKSNLSSEVPKGARGAIVMVYDSSNYVVEFIDENGNHLALLTVNANDLGR
jgi:hypothetical protein